MNEFNSPVLRAALQVSYPDGSSQTLVASSEIVSRFAEPGAGRDLTESEAAELTGRIENALTHTDELLIAAHVGRIWIGMECASWDAWADKFFGDRPLVSFARRDRPVLVQALSNGGLSSRAIGRAIGVDQKTVLRDISSTEANASVEPDGQARETIVGRDGKERQRKKPAKQPGIPECEICGDFLQECADLPEGECEQYNKFVLGERSLPPGPKMPPRPRNRTEKKQTILEPDVVYSLDGGRSHTEDQVARGSDADAETDQSADEVLCIGVNPDDAAVEAEQSAALHGVLDRGLVVLTDGFAAMSADMRKANRLVAASTGDGLVPLDAGLARKLRDFHDGLVQVAADFPSAIAAAATMLSMAEGKQP